MLGPVEKITLAHSAGATFLTLLIHVGAGMGAIVSGYIAVAVAKGGAWHRRAGIVFVYTMIIMGLFGATVATIEGKTGSVIGGILAAYLVFTGFTTVRPIGGRALAAAMTLVSVVLAFFMLWGAMIAWNTPGFVMGGVPDGMKYFLFIIAALAATGDLRVFLAGSIKGSRRIARHLWRLCFGLFIAAGSFFLGQMQVLPKALQIVPLMLALSVAPLVILLYWMWRVRLKQSLRGLTTTVPLNDPYPRLNG